MRRAETSTEEEEAAVENQDLLSSLPESIIGHIFSFLPIKDILRTTAVSKRWKRLWTNTPTISYSSDWIKSYIGRDLPGLCSSLNRAFSQCSLTRFHIDGIYYEPPRKQFFDFWLRSALVHRVLDITLSVHQQPCGGPAYLLPMFFFTCPSLVSLHLHSCYFTLCRSVSWNSLKVFRVGNVEVTDGLLDVVLNGSPSLECLELVRCWGMNYIRLDSRKLRVLVINGYTDPRYYFRVVRAEEAQNGGLTLGISAPHLLSLQTLGKWCGKREVCLHQVSSMMQVKLDFELTTFVEHMDEMYTLLLRALSSVNSLMIGSQIMMSLALNIKIMTPPLGLRCPTLILGDSVKGSSLLGLKTLLDCTRHVEKLVIYFNRKRYIGLDCDLLFGKKKPWVNHLKTIEMNGFQANPPKIAKCELLIVGFLLREAVVLEKMVINARGDSIEEELKREVLGFPRASKASKVIFNYLHS